MLLAALGARPNVPPIPGIGGKNVLLAEYAYQHPEEVGSTVVVLGGGLVGVELAIHLAGLGRKVTVVEMLPILNNGGNILHQNALDVEIKARGIRLALGTRVVGIDENGVTGEKGGEMELFPADTVLCAVGQTPRWEEADSLRFYAPEFYALGDCVTPKNIMQATAMADAIAMNI